MIVAVVIVVFQPSIIIRLLMLLRTVGTAAAAHAAL